MSPNEGKCISLSFFKLHTHSCKSFIEGTGISIVYNIYLSKGRWFVHQGHLWFLTALTRHIESAGKAARDDTHWKIHSLFIELEVHTQEKTKHTQRHCIARYIQVYIGFLLQSYCLYGFLSWDIYTLWLYTETSINDTPWPVFTSAHSMQDIKHH